MIEKIIETKVCTHCNSKFDITDKDIDFLNKMSPVFNGEKFQILPSDLCWECKIQRRYTWKNMRNLYKRKCDATGKMIISMYPPDNGITVYNLDLWWSDKWDVMDYFLDIDFNKSLFKQYYELIKKVPKRALIKGTGSVNCDYTNCVGGSNNSYLIFDSVNCDECYYSNGLIDCNNCFDSSFSRSCSYSYMLFNSTDCFKAFYVFNSMNCSNSKYLSNCVNCNDCFGCVNLNNKSYYIFNTKYSKEEYFIKLDSILKSGYDINDFMKFTLDYPVINLININSEHVLGNSIFNSKDIINSYDIYDAENIKDSIYVHTGAKDCKDVDVVLNNSSRAYDCSLLNKVCTNMLFCYDCWNNCQNLIYCSECKLTTDCFMCNGLIGKQYCILNKQYTKDEYEILVSKIINKMKDDGEWGKFPPASMSLFGYNESYAQEFFPLTKNEALKKGFNWSDYELPLPKAEKIIPANKLPKNIADIPDDILNWAIECEITKKPFRIIKQELEFYRKNTLPIPKKHPDQRHLDRMKLRNPGKLYDRKCDKCNIDIKTTYSPDREENVYCENCYNKIVY